jgi:hypothetical protein
MILRFEFILDVPCRVKKAFLTTLGLALDFANNLEKKQVINLNRVYYLVLGFDILNPIT